MKNRDIFKLDWIDLDIGVLVFEDEDVDNLEDSDVISISRLFIVCFGVDVRVKNEFLEFFCIYYVFLIEMMLDSSVIVLNIRSLIWYLLILIFLQLWFRIKYLKRDVIFFFFMFEILVVECYSLWLL